MGKNQCLLILHSNPPSQGLAHCYRQTDAGLTPVTIVEPVSANSLECMAAGGATSFSQVAAVRARAALDRSFAASLPPAWAAAPLCDEWDARVGACARTWARPHAVDALMDLVPLGSVKDGWNATAQDGPHKRVLGAAVEVSDADNVKQDMSIDVYGRGDHASAVDGGLGADKIGSAAASSDDDDSAAVATVSSARVAKAGAKAAPADDDLDALLGL